MYQIMNGDNPLVTFQAIKDVEGYRYKIEDYKDEEQMPFLLQSLGVSNGSLTEWIGRRTIPVNRHHMEILLDKLNLNNKFETLLYCKGLSLNDCFWIKDTNSDDTFDKINLYDNQFDEALGWMAFTGIPSEVSKNLSTPELTTVGVLPKYWERKENGIYLIKSGTYGYANAGREPLVEVISSIVANKIKINSIPYVMGKRNKKDVSICKLFTSKEIGMVTMNDLLVKEFKSRKFVSLTETIDKIKELKLEIEPLYDMIFFDALIRNPDRHLNNFSYLRNNKTGQLMNFAPLWDTGECLDSKKMNNDNPIYYKEDVIFSAYDIPYSLTFGRLSKNKYRDKINIIRKLLNSGSLTEEFIEKCGIQFEERIKICCDILNVRCDLIEKTLIEAEPLSTSNIFQ